MESSSSSARKQFPPKRGQTKVLAIDLIKKRLITTNPFKVSRASMAGPRRRKLDESRLSEENIPMVTLDAAPNDAEEDQVPYAAARESEEPADNLARPNSEESIPLVTLDAAPNDAEEEQVPYAATRESKAPADNLAKPNSEEWIFLVTSLCMEILSAACDQASSPSRPRYALFGMLLAIAALLTCICELIYKGRKNNVVWRKRGCCMLFGSDIEIFGLVGGIAQCVCSIIQYVYYIRRAENPIKLSILPAIFLICLIVARLSRKRMQTRDETGEHTA